MNRFSITSKMHLLKAILSIALIANLNAAQASTKKHSNAESHKHHNQHPHHQGDSIRQIPRSLGGLDIVLQIEAALSAYNHEVPYQGAIVKRFNANGTFTAQSTGTLSGQLPQATYGNYKYRTTGPKTAIETTFNSAANNSPSTTVYTFTSATSGTWETQLDEGQTTLSGSFNLEVSNLTIAQHYAPASIADTNMALIIQSAASNLPANTYPARGLVLQTYAQDGTLILQGFGPGTLNSHGTYSYTKVSANTAVEEVTQVSDYFTLPYTMVYTFETPTSGKWFQNFGDGLIKFHGTFDTFPN